MKFTEWGGHAAITLRLCPGPGPAAVRVPLEVVVQDSGIGIAADRLPGLFTRFRQADASTARLFGGTGLGLAITQQLAALMDGAVSVEGRGPPVARRGTFTRTCTSPLAAPSPPS